MRTRSVLGSILILAATLGTGGAVLAQDASTGPAASPGASGGLPSTAPCPSPAPASASPSGAVDACGMPVPTESFASLTGTQTNLIVAVGPGTAVRAYACDGDSTALWWTGESSDGTFNAVSTDGGATLDVTLGDSVDGTVTFTDGTAIAFSAQPTTGAQGLYSVELLADGTMSGTSLGGNTFTGQFDFAANSLSGEVTTPAGTIVTITASQASTGGTTSPGSYLAVLDAVGQAKGFQLKVPGKPSEGFITGWVMP